IRQIAATPGQEIATHTLSHYYTLEEGQTLEAFEADLGAALEIASRHGIDIRSIVFPRNQYSSDHLDVCRQRGIRSYRGNPKSWAYEATGKVGQTKVRRAFRLADAHTGFL